MDIYPYGETETQFLSMRDPVLGKQIQRIGHIRREINPNVFGAIVESIISQQINGKAADAILGRALALTGGFTPARILAKSEDEFRACGMSGRKASYVMDVARAAKDGDIDLNTLENKPDDEVIRALTQLRGVGQWTAEMVLIFSLCRPNVISYTDFGIRKGMIKLYGYKDLSRNQFNQHARQYEPYATVASLYLWHIAGENDEQGDEGPPFSEII